MSLIFRKYIDYKTQLNRIECSMNLKLAEIEQLPAESVCRNHTDLIKRAHSIQISLYKRALEYCKYKYLEEKGVQKN